MEREEKSAAGGGKGGDGGRGSSNSAAAAEGANERRGDAPLPAAGAASKEDGGEGAAAAAPAAAAKTTLEESEDEGEGEEELKAKASEGLRMLLQHKPPSTPDVALVQQHKENHADCSQLLDRMQQLLEKRLYHEFTLASLAYLAPLALLGSSTSSTRGGGGGEGKGNTLAAQLAAAAALPFLPCPAGFPTFQPFERITFFHRVIAPLRPKLDLPAFLRLLAAVCEDLEPVDALVFLREHRLVEVRSDGRQQQQQQSSSSSSRSSRTSGGGSAGSAAAASSSTINTNAATTSSSSSSTTTAASSSSRAGRSASSGDIGGRGGGFGGGGSSSFAEVAAALEAELLFRSCESYHLSRYEKLTQSEEILEDLRKKLAVTMGVSPTAQAAFHRAAATLAKAQDKHAEFYQHAMMFLAYTPAASIPENERVGLAYEVATAALVAPDIFNFGELLQQALVISSLQLPEHRWLYDLVEAFQCGSMAKYDETCSRFARQIRSTALASHQAALRRKISISALLRLAFTHSAAGAATAATAEGEEEGGAGEEDEGEEGRSRRNRMEAGTTQGAAAAAGGAGGGGGGEGAIAAAERSAAARSLSFQAVANACRVSLDEVELLVMSAMSKQLLRGTIDQVSRRVNISWVRPALLLDNSGMACLQERLLRWVATAQQLHQHLQAQTAELLGS